MNKFSARIFKMLSIASIVIVTEHTLASSVADAGKKAYESGNYAVALQELGRLAEVGNIDAQALLGVMYAKGQGVPVDEIAAVKWYTKAATKGHIDAQIQLSDMYSNGKGVRKDEAIGAYWQWRAAEGFVDIEKKTLDATLSQQEDKMKAPEIDCEKKPYYPSLAQRYRQEGSVTLLFLVDAQGKLMEATIDKSSGWTLLDRQARDGLSLCKFYPARINDKPVAGALRLRYRFTLD